MSHRIRSLVVAGLASGLALSGVGGVATAGANVVHHPLEKNRCPSSDKYLRAMSATDHHGVVHITGFHALKFCDKNAEFIKTRKKSVQFTVIKGGSIKVYKHPRRPDSAISINAAKFPAYLKQNQDENWYTFTGPANGIKTMTPAFQS